MASKKSAKSAKTTKTKTAPVMDVAKPGKTPPDASSRPIIVAHRPMVKDDTVSTETAAEAGNTSDEGEKIPVSRTAPKVIKPLTTEESPESPVEEPSEVTAAKQSPSEPEQTEAEASDSETPEAPSEDSESTAPSEEGEESEAPPTSDETSASEEEATVNAVAGQTPDKKAEAAQAEADRKQQEHLSQLIADKKYHLPIRSAKRRRRTGWLALLLIIVLLLGAGFYMLRYTDLVDTTGLNLPAWLTGESQEATEETPPPDDQEEETVTPVSDAKDTQRESDINALAARLESYYLTNGYYPSLGQLNDPNFRADHLSDLEPDAYQDPDSTSSVLAINSSTGRYGYATTPETCDNTATNCIAFVLSATLSDDTVFQKQSITTN